MCISISSMNYRLYGKSDHPLPVSIRNSGDMESGILVADARSLTCFDFSRSNSIKSGNLSISFLRRRRRDRKLLANTDQPVMFSP